MFIEGAQVLTPAKGVIISAAVMGLVQLLKVGGLPAKIAPIAVFLTSALTLVFFGWSQSDLTRATSFDYFATCIQVSLAAMGIFGLAQTGTQVAQNVMSPETKKLIVIFAVVSCLTLTQSAFACRVNPLTIKAAAEASKDLGKSTTNTVKAVTTAYEQHLLTYEQKNKFADLMIAVADGGKHGTNVIDELNQQYGGEIKKVPAENWAAVVAIFQNEVVSPFLTFLQELNKITPSTAANIRIALAAVQSAILTISAVFGQQQALQDKIDRLSPDINAPVNLNASILPAESFRERMVAGFARVVMAGAPREVEVTLV